MLLAALGADEVETREVFDIPKLYCKYRGFATKWSEKMGVFTGRVSNNTPRGRCTPHRHDQITCRLLIRPCYLHFHPYIVQFFTGWSAGRTRFLSKPVEFNGNTGSEYINRIKICTFQYTRQHREEDSPYVLHEEPTGTTIPEISSS